MKIICYDISVFIKRKLALENCPCCQTSLKSRGVEHSQASRVFVQEASAPVITTSLSQCSACGWWAVRELRADDALYHPPVKEIIIMCTPKKDKFRLKNDAVSWEQVLVDEAYWQDSVAIQSREAVELFGPTQMLLPNILSFSRQEVFDKMKSVAPILLPILVVLLIVIFYSG